MFFQAGLTAIQIGFYARMDVHANEVFIFEHNKIACLPSKDTNETGHDQSSAYTHGT